MLDVIAQSVGWIGSALLVISLLQRRMKRLRIINSIAAAALVGYNLWIGSWPMVGMNLAVALVDVYFLVDGARHPGAQEAGSRTTTAAIEPGTELDR